MELLHEYVGGTGYNCQFCGTNGIPISNDILHFKSLKKEDVLICDDCAEGIAEAVYK